MHYNSILYCLFIIITVLKTFILANTYDSCLADQYSYNSKDDSCLKCPQDCSECINEKICIKCNNSKFLVIEICKDQFQKQYFNYKQEESTGECISKCNNGYYQNSLLKQCIKCQIQNCLICNQDNTCQECTKGWVKSEDKKVCLSKNCDDNSIYDQQQNGKCTYYCPEGYNKQQEQCFSFKTIENYQQQFESLSIDEQSDILQLYIETIQAKKYVIQIKFILYYYFTNDFLILKQIIALYKKAALFYTEDLMPYYKVKFNEESYLSSYKFENNIYVLFDSRIKLLTISIDTGQTSLRAVIQLQQTQSQSFQNQFYFVVIDNTLLKYELTSNKTMTISRLYKQQPIEINIYLNEDFRITNEYEPSKIANDNNHIEKNKNVILIDGCEFYQPSGFDTDPKLLPNPLVDIEMFNQQNSKSQEFQINQMIQLPEIEKILLFDIKSNLLSIFNEKDPNSSIEIQFHLKNVGYLNCAGVKDNEIYLILNSQLYTYLAKIKQEPDKSYSFINLKKINEFIQIQSCYYSNKYQYFIVYDGQSVTIHTLEEQQEKINDNWDLVSSEGDIDYFLKNDDKQIFLTQQNEQKLTLKIIPFDINGFLTEKKLEFSLNKIILNQQMIYKNSLFFMNESNQLLFSIQSTIILLGMKDKQPEPIIKYSSNVFSKVEEDFGNTLQVLQITQEDAICVVYEYGFKIVYFNSNRQNFQSGTYFKIAEGFIQNLLIILSNKQDTLLIFNIKQGKFQIPNIDVFNPQKIKIFVNINFTTIVIFQTESTILYIIDDKQAINAYLLNIEIDIDYSESNQNRLFLLLKSFTLIVYDIDYNQLIFKSTVQIQKLSLITYYVVMNQNVIMFTSICDSKSISIFYNIDTQSVIKKKEYFKFEMIAQICKALTKANIIAFDGDIGSNKTYFYNLDKDTLTTQPQMTGCNTNQFDIISEQNIIFENTSKWYIFNINSQTTKPIDHPSTFLIRPYLKFSIDLKSMMFVQIASDSIIIVYDISSNTFKQLLGQYIDFTKLSIQFVNEQQLITRYYDSLSSYYYNEYLILTYSTTFISSQFQVGKYLAYFSQVYDETLQKGLRQITIFDKEIKTTKFYILDDNCTLQDFIIIDKQFYVIQYNNQAKVFVQNLESKKIFDFGLGGQIVFAEQIQLFIILTDKLLTITDLEQLKKKEIQLKSILSLTTIMNNFTYLPQLDSVIIKLTSINVLILYNYKDKEVEPSYIVDQYQVIQFQHLIYFENNKLYVVGFKSINLFQIIDKDLIYLKTIQFPKQFTDKVIISQTVQLVHIDTESNQFVFFQSQILLIIYELNMESDINDFKTKCQFETFQYYKVEHVKEKKIAILLGPDYVYSLNLNSTDCQVNKVLHINLNLASSIKQRFSLLISDVVNDLLYVSSITGFNILQLSNLKYLSGYQYPSILSNAYLPSLIKQTKEIVALGNTKIYVIDIMTPLFNINKDIQFIQMPFFFVFQDKYLNFNQNYGVIELYNKAQERLYQVKIGALYTNSKFKQLINKISDTQVIIFQSNQQFQVFDINLNNLSESTDIGEKCLSIKFYQKDVYCLTQNSSIKKFSKDTFQQPIVFNNIENQITDFYALSSDIVGLVDNQNKLYIWNQSLPKVSFLLTLESSFKILLEKIYLVITYKRSILCYQYSSKILDFVQKFELKEKSFRIQSFYLFQQIDQPLLIYSNNERSYIYNMESGNLVVQIQNSCQVGQKIIEDQYHFYLISASHLILYDKQSLKQINYIFVNQFTQSKIKSAKWIVEDYFIITLIKGLQLVRINSGFTKLLQSFSDIENPHIIEVLQKYNNTNLIGFTIIGYKNFCLFKIEISNLIQESQQNQFTLQIIDSPLRHTTYSQNTQLQKRVYSEQINLGKFIVSYSSSGSVIFKIPIEYNIIKKSTIIQHSSINYQAKQQNTTIQSIIFKDNQFLSDIKNLVFYEIEVDVRINKSELNFNKIQNLDYLMMDQFKIVFNQLDSSLIISNCNNILVQEIIIENQLIENTKTNLIIQYATSIKINNMTIRNIIVNSSTLISFENNLEVYINFLEIENSQFGQDFLQFQNSTNVIIQQMNFKNSSITKGNILSLKKSQEVKIKNLNILNISNNKIADKIMPNVTNKKQKIKENENLRNMKQQNENQLNSMHLLFISGCMNTLIQNVIIDKLQNVGIIKSEEYKESIYSYYDNVLINIINMTITDLILNQNDPTGFQLYGQQVNITRMNVTNSKIKNNFIYLQPKNSTNITSSTFKDIEMGSGSLFNMTGGEIFFNKSTFNNITSDQASVLTCSDSSLIQIEQTFFDIITCSNIVQNDKKCLGGAIYLQNINHVNFSDNKFTRCSSFHDGGAIYFSEFQLGEIILKKNTFISNVAKNNSGGALYFKQANNIILINNTFDSNFAKQDRGGAIVLYSSVLKVLNETNVFINNVAQIGGAIWYFQQPEILKHDNLDYIKKINTFENNKGYYYGANIGSYPTTIKMVQKDNTKISDRNDDIEINKLSSGNQIDGDVYFNFFDEEGQPLQGFIYINKTKEKKETDRNKMENYASDYIIQESESYNMFITSNDNPDLIIKFGSMFERNIFEFNNTKDLSLGDNSTRENLIFKLQFTSLYRNQNIQKAQIYSNLINENYKVSIPVLLKYRDCERGEIITVNDNFIECTECLEGKYSLVVPNMEKDKNSLICKPCPDEAINCSGSDIILQDGFWRESKYSDDIYPCKTKGCSEFTYFNQSSKFTDEITCLKGYIGPLCDSCDNYAKVWGDVYGKKNESCFLCKSEYEQYINFIFIFIGYLLYIIHCLRNLINRQIMFFKLDLFRKIDLLITSRSCTSGEDSVFQIKILMHYLQLISVISNFSLNQPQFIENFVGFVGDPTNSKVMSLDCMAQLSDSYPVWVHRLIIKALTVILQYLIINLCIYAFNKIKQKNAYTREQIKITAGLSFVFIYLFYQPSISKYIISSLFCKKIGENYYLITEMSTQCYTTTYIIQILVLVIPLFFVWSLLIPYYFYIKLREFQKSNTIRNRLNQVMIFGVIYKGYKEKYLHWELLKIYKKLLIMIVINFDILEEIRLSLIIIVVLIYTFKLYQDQPHQSINQFQVEKNLMKKLIFTYLLLYSVMYNRNKTEEIIQYFGMVIIIFINLQAIYYIILLLFGSINILIKKTDSKQLIDQIKMKLYFLKQKYPNSFKFLKFRNANLLRIHQLWKIVIVNFRQDQFRKFKHQELTSKLKKTMLLSNSQNTCVDNLQSPKYDADDQDYLFKSMNLKENDFITNSIPQTFATQIMTSKEQPIIDQFAKSRFSMNTPKN